MSVRDVPLNVVKLGEGGVPLVMLHGWAHSLENLRGLGELLSQDREVHLIDLPGFGQSGAPQEVWGVAQYVERIKAYIDEAGLKQFDILGHSFGGKVAVPFCAKYPELVRRAVLINTSALRPIRPPRERFRMACIRTLGKVLKFLKQQFDLPWYESYFIRRYASADYKQAGTLRATFVKTLNEDFTDDARRMKVPTLLLWGEEDTETRLEIGKRLNALIQNSKLLVLPGRGHEPFRDTGAHLVAFHLRPFLALQAGELQNA